MSPFELLAVLLGIANIVLLIRRRIENYPCGLLMVALYAWIFFHAKLYSDTLLQVFFFIIQIVGWVEWSRARNSTRSEVPVRSSSPRTLLLSLASTIAGAALLGAAMQRWTDASFPFADAVVAALSVVAQFLLNSRRTENWLWWIAADLVAAVLYTRKALYPTAALYVLFLVMAVLGYRTWRAQAALHIEA